MKLGKSEKESSLASNGKGIFSPINSYKLDSIPQNDSARELRKKFQKVKLAIDSKHLVVFISNHSNDAITQTTLRKLQVMITAIAITKITILTSAIIVDLIDGFKKL